MRELVNGAHVRVFQRAQALLGGTSLIMDWTPQWAKASSGGPRGDHIKYARFFLCPSYCVCVCVLCVVCIWALENENATSLFFNACAESVKLAR